MPSTTRRQFLATAAVSAAFAGRAMGANESLRVGIVGSGGRARFLMKALARVPNTRQIALCDVQDGALEQARPLADPQAFVTHDYHALLERKDVDAVLIGSPDHWHVPMTIDACAAKKDVYVEKPLTHKPSEGEAVIAAQNQHQRIVQVGTQQRSMTHLIAARELVRAGQLGNVIKIHMTWNRNTDRVRRNAPDITMSPADWKRFLGNAPEQPFDSYKMRNWRWFWDFGGGIFTDLMVHWLDTVHWMLDLDHPERAVSAGVHTVSKGVWETPDTVQTLLSYPNGLQLHFEGTFGNARNGSMTEIMGSDATLYFDRGRFEVIPERTMKVEAREMVLGTGRKGLDFYDKPDGELLHLTNWVECIRSRQKPSCPAEAGVAAAAGAHLANRALRTGQVAVWARS